MLFAQQSHIHGIIGREIRFGGACGSIDRLILTLLLAVSEAVLPRRGHPSCDGKHPVVTDFMV